MTLKTQLQTLKNNWLIVVVLLIVLGMNFFGDGVSPLYSITSKLGVAEMGIAADAAYGRGYSGGIVPSYGDGFAPEAEERILTTSAYLSTEVKRGKFQEAEGRLKSIITSTDSFLLNENVYKSGEIGLQYFSGNYQIKVESSKYDAVVMQLKELGEILSFSENTDDITGSYLSIRDQLEVEKARLQRYQQLFAEAKDINDKLLLNDRIFDQERTIKYLEDSLKDTNLRVEYVTIQFSLQEKQSGYAGIALIKFAELMRQLVSSINGLLSLLFLALPYALVAFIVWFGYRRFAKK
ncbi:MAG: DUF4349 domain-containing protein [Nanoarchaeota archaeon]|nr:DUF4349 domain-containing protein [Nanoarchaeota archaeon]